MDENLSHLLHQQQKTLLDAIALMSDSSSDPFRFQDPLLKVKHALDLCDVMLMDYDKEGR